MRGKNEVVCGECGHRATLNEWDHSMGSGGSWNEDGSADPVF